MKKALALIMCVAAMAVVTGCFTSATAYTERTLKDGSAIKSQVKIIGTGDKVSQLAAEGLFADGTDEDLGAGVKKASASQQSTGIDGTLNGLGQLMTGMAKFMAASQGVKVPQSVDSSASDESTAPTVLSEALPAETVAANATALASKMAEAKSSGKPLVVIAGNTGCGYCTKLDRLIDSDPAFLSRTDIVLYRETSAWANNQAGKWTGGGKFPVLRVTQWAPDGSIVCDKKVNRPQTIAEIESSLKTCEVTQ